MVNSTEREEYLQKAPSETSIGIKKDTTTHDSAYVLHCVYEVITEGWYLRDPINMRNRSEWKNHFPCWYQRVLVLLQRVLLREIFSLVFFMHCGVVVVSILLAGITAPYTQMVGELIYTHSISAWLIPTVPISVVALFLLWIVFPHKYGYILEWSDPSYGDTWTDKSIEELENRIHGNVSSVMIETEDPRSKRSIVMVEITTRYAKDSLVLYLQHDGV